MTIGFEEMTKGEAEWVVLGERAGQALPERTAEPRRA